MKKFEMITNTNGIDKEMRIFIDNLICEINKYCITKDYCVTDKAVKYINKEINRIIKSINSESIVQVATIAQNMFDKFESFSEENKKMLHLVSIINDTCLEDLDNEIHQFLLDNIIEQCQMRILTDMEYQKYLIAKVKKIKEM